MPDTRECPSCASMVPDDANRCFICGYEFSEDRPRRNWRAWVAVGLLIVFLYPLVRFLIQLLK